MSFEEVSSGKNLPNDINVIIEIPLNGDPIKYEVDKDSGEIFVDRMLGTAMHYPCNYGYVPHTLCGDGDPVDVMVVMPLAVVPGAVIRCRPVGVLKMTDDGGEDAKIIAVPHEKITPLFNDVQDINDLPELTLNQISHFFQHYKDLEQGKWVKIEGYGDINEARKEIADAAENFANATDKPHF